MASPATAARQLVVVLHMRQPLGIDLVATFPPEHFDVRVMTAADPPAVFRPGVVAGVPVASVAEPEWAAEVRALAGLRPEVVTNDEYCLAQCSSLRALVGSQACHPAVLDAYRDKVVMKRMLAAGGVDVPECAELEPVPEASGAGELVARLGLPVVVKPRRESNNRGVEILRDAGALEDWLARHAGLSGWQAESCVAGRFLHANAIVSDGVVTPVIVGEYTGSLLALGAGEPVGSVSVPETSAAARAGRDLCGRVVAALGGEGRFVLHAEFVLTEDGPPIVLEAAARAPGALVSEIAAVSAGIQLEQANLRMQAGEPPPRPRETGLHAAWIWFPQPASGHDRIRRPALRSAHRLQLLAPGSFPAATLMAWNPDRDALCADLATLREQPVVW